MLFNGSTKKRISWGQVDAFQKRWKIKRFSTVHDNFTPLRPIPFRLLNQILANGLHLSRPLQAPGTYRCQKIKLHIFIFVLRTIRIVPKIYPAIDLSAPGPKTTSPGPNEP